MRKQPPFFISLKALIRNAGEVVYDRGIFSDPGGGLFMIGRFSGPIGRSTSRLGVYTVWRRCGIAQMCPNRTPKRRFQGANLTEKLD